MPYQFHVGGLQQLEVLFIVVHEIEGMPHPVKSMEFKTSPSLVICQFHVGGKHQQL